MKSIIYTITAILAGLLMFLTVSCSDMMEDYSKFAGISEKKEVTDDGITDPGNGDNGAPSAIFVLNVDNGLQISDNGGMDFTKFTVHEEGEFEQNFHVNSNGNIMITYGNNRTHIAAIDAEPANSNSFWPDEIGIGEYSITGPAASVPGVEFFVLMGVDDGIYYSYDLLRFPTTDQADAISVLPNIFPETDPGEVSLWAFELNGNILIFAYDNFTDILQVLGSDDGENFDSFEVMFTPDKHWGIVDIAVTGNEIFVGAKDGDGGGIIYKATYSTGDDDILFDEIHTTTGDSPYLAVTPGGRIYSVDDSFHIIYSDDEGASWTDGAGITNNISGLATDYNARLYILGPPATGLEFSDHGDDIDTLNSGISGWKFQIVD